jgi:hypothetical protein
MLLAHTRLPTKQQGGSIMRKQVGSVLCWCIPWWCGVVVYIHTRYNSVLRGDMHTLNYCLL